MAALTDTNAIKTISTHYIDGAFVKSHGREVMDIIRPTDAKVIGRVTLGDEEDTRRAIAAARRAFAALAARRRKSAPTPCAGCMGPCRRASTISPPRWSKNTEASRNSRSLLWNPEPTPSSPLKRGSQSYP